MTAKPHRGDSWVIWTGRARENARYGLGETSYLETVEHLRLRGDEVIRVQPPGAKSATVLRLRDLDPIPPGRRLA